MLKKFKIINTMMNFKKNLQVEAGHMLNLECDYKLEGDTLYSLKWYRDDKEFYRYIPRGGDVLSISIRTHTFNFNIR